MIQQMTGGGWKVFNDDTGQFIGAFHDKGLAEMVNERKRGLTSEELTEFSKQNKVIAVPDNVKTELVEAVMPEVVPSGGFVEAVGIKKKVGRSKKKK